MKIEQLNRGVIHKFWLSPTTEETFEPGLRKARMATIWKDGESSSLLLKQDGVAYQVREESITSSKLDDLCTINLPRLAWIADLRPARSASRALLMVHQFPREFSFPKMELAVDEKIIEQVNVFPKGVEDARGVIDCLTDQCLLAEEGAGTRSAFLSAGEGELHDEPPAFVLHGRSLKVFVRKVRRKTSEGSDVETLVVDKVTRSGQATERHPVYLATGRISFIDATVAGQWAASTRATLSSLANSDQSFLQIWHQYGEMERSSVARRVKAFGAIEYSYFENAPEGMRFDLISPLVIDQVNLLEPKETFEATVARPDFEALLIPNAPAAPPPQFAGRSVSKPRAGSRSITLKGEDPNQMPPASGFLAISVLGDRTRLDRRNRAQDAIREARCPMPHLGLLLEGADVPTARRSRIKPLSQTVIDKVFTDSKSRVSLPNPRQEDAIALALNTPDIALIQGPPGTGKTTVIRAIVERLNELVDRTERSVGTFLVTAFQHDAVGNAIEKLRVNELPAIKFGKRNGVDGFEEAEREIHEWRLKTAGRIRDKFPDANRPPVHQQIRDLVNAYILSPGDPARAMNLIDDLLSLKVGERQDVRGVLSSSLLRRANEVRQELAEAGSVSDKGVEDVRLLIRAIRGLRSRPEAFADDGPQTALQVKARLERIEILDEATDDLLGRAADWSDPSTPPPFLDDLTGLRRRLLLNYLPRGRRDRQPGVRRNVSELLANIQDALELVYRQSMNGIDAATAEYRSLLENNPEAVKRTVMDYTAVFGATCSGSARREIAEVKGMDDLIYETVLVDEAARSNPLDLFIPLTQARRRIILVGDHRQLPHIIDSEIERELERAVLEMGEESVAKKTDEVIRESLFQRLFALMQERERKDEIPRTITLNVQFRMHPKLGQFVSQQFYPEREQFGSGKPPEAFRLDLPGYEGRTAAWIDVPAEEGSDLQDRKKSRFRASEAKKIAAEVARLIQCENSQEEPRSIGVITFYKAQEDEIKRQLGREGLMFADDAGDYHVAADYQKGERFRVGTVDAFQGKEFDVVFLSMVRSNDLPDGDELSRRRKYGHLMSPNRMCVSMSRQKQLLVVVGDAGMLKSAEAKEAIGPLVAFHALAQGELNGKPQEEVSS